MIPKSEGPTTQGSAYDSSDDTIEVELTVEQVQALSQAAEAARETARPDESAPVLSVPEYENITFRRTARIDFVCNVTFAVAVLGIVVAFLWPASTRHPPAPAPAVTRAAPVAEPAPAVPVEPLGAPVRIKNAFDPTEVFEFPYGTTESEAREAVAERLLSRARDRRAEGLALGRASNLQAARGAAVQQPEVFVTRYESLGFAARSLLKVSMYRPYALNSAFFSSVVIGFAFGLRPSIKRSKPNNPTPQP